MIQYNIDVQNLKISFMGISARLIQIRTEGHTGLTALHCLEHQMAPSRDQSSVGVSVGEGGAGGAQTVWGSSWWGFWWGGCHHSHCHCSVSRLDCPSDNHLISQSITDFVLCFSFSKITWIALSHTVTISSPWVEHDRPGEDRGCHAMPACSLWSQLVVDWRRTLDSLSVSPHTGFHNFPGTFQLFLNGNLPVTY